MSDDTHRNVKVTVATDPQSQRVHIQIACPVCGEESFSLRAAHLPIVHAVIGSVMEEEGMDTVDDMQPESVTAVPDAVAKARIRNWKQ